jgi:HEPN domain-containing protein
MNRGDFQQLAKVRLHEAKLLLSSGAPDGAYYLAGYAIECALKACIARKTKRYDFADKKTVLDSHTHDFKELLGPAGLKQDHAILMLQPAFAENWKTVTEWKADSRYANHSIQKAQVLLDAITDRRVGVLQWIKQYW